MEEAMGKTIKTIMIIPGPAGWQYRDMDSGVPVPDRPPEKVNVIRSARLQARLDTPRPQPAAVTKKRKKKKPTAAPIAKMDWLRIVAKQHPQVPGEKSDEYAQRLFGLMRSASVIKPFATWQTLRRRLYALAARARRESALKRTAAR
jgi:hypothetical protein